MITGRHNIDSPHENVSVVWKKYQTLEHNRDTNH